MMRVYAVTRIFAFLVTYAIVLCLALPDAQAQKQKDLSDKAVRILSRLAMKLVPAKIKDAKGEIVAIDKSKPNTVLIPLDDARQVIKTARLSAHAHICQMPELEATNYLTMMASERSRKKWSKSQLVFINRLHLFTVMWMSGSAEVTKTKNTGGAKKRNSAKESDKQIEAAKKMKKKQCGDTEKAAIRKRIEASVKAARARLKKS